MAVYMLEWNATAVLIVISSSYFLFTILFAITFVYLHKIEYKRPEKQTKDEGGTAGEKKRSQIQLKHPPEYYRRMAQLPGKLVLSIGSLIVIVVAFLATDVLDHPLSTRGYSTLTHYAFLVVIGHEFYRLMAFTCFLPSNDRVTPLVNRLMTLVTCCTVTFAQEDTMLVFSGLVYQIPFALVVYDITHKGQRFRSYLRHFSFISTIVYLFIFPGFLLVYSVVVEGFKESLSIWTQIVHLISIMYFGLKASRILRPHISIFLKWAKGKFSARNLVDINEKAKLIDTENGEDYDVDEDKVNVFYIRLGEKDETEAPRYQSDSVMVYAKLNP